MSEARKGLADPTANTRQAALRKRREAQGLTRREFWLQNWEYEAVKAFVAKMRGKK